MATKFRLTPQQAREHWIKTLRSGRFKQGRSALCQHKQTEDRSSDKLHCCLGVACELYRELENPAFTVKYDKGDGEYEYGRGKQARKGTLPEVVRKWLGLRTDSGEYFLSKKAYEADKRDEWIAGSTQSSLTDLNDGGKSFDYIANRLEKNPPGLWEDGSRNG